VSKGNPSPKGKSKKTSGMSHFNDEDVELLRHRDQYVVVDTDSDYVYLGKLLSISGHFITLGHADAHDRQESASKNEKYILDSKKYGVRTNRREVHIRLERVVSYSLLDDVTDY